MQEEIKERVHLIRLDQDHGANWLAQESLRTLALSASVSRASEADDLLVETRMVAHQIANARPGMAVVTNLVSSLVWEVEARSYPDVESARRFVMQESAKLEGELRDSTTQAAGHFVPYLAAATSVMTCCYSSTVLEALRLASLAGARPRVFVAESVAATGKSYGRDLAAALGDNDVDCVLIADEEIGRKIEGVDLAFTGVDSIRYDGTVVNGVPTFALALAAHPAGVPYYAVGDLSKLDVAGHLKGDFLLEDGFDATPAHMVAGIVTDQGVLLPSDVASEFEVWVPRVRELLAI